MEFKDYYQILGVTKASSQDEIKVAFRKLAKKYHPDANPGANSDKKFKEINEAYEVLGNSEKRAKYDKLGTSYNNFRQTGGNSSDFNWSEWFDNSGWTKERRSKGFSGIGDMFQGGNVSDFFEKVFGQGFSSKAQSKVGNTKGQDVTAEIVISLEEAFSGTNRVIETNGNTINIKIKPGVCDGQELKITGQGQQARRGGQKGDLLIKITVTPHKKVERVGDDLYIDVPIDLYMAILGGALKVQTFAGKVEIKIAPETQQGKVLRLKGLGMPKYSNPQQKGDLYIKFIIEIPKGLSEKEKQLFDELKAIRGKN